MRWQEEDQGKPQGLMGVPWWQVTFSHLDVFKVQSPQFTSSVPDQRGSQLITWQLMDVRIFLKVQNLPSSQAPTLAVPDGQEAPVPNAWPSLGSP
jgi:hypothetical protein